MQMLSIYNKSFSLMGEEFSFYTFTQELKLYMIEYDLKL